MLISFIQKRCCLVCLTYLTSAQSWPVRLSQYPTFLPTSRIELSVLLWSVTGRNAIAGDQIQLMLEHSVLFFGLLNVAGFVALESEVGGELAEEDCRRGWGG